MSEARVHRREVPFPADPGALLRSLVRARNPFWLDSGIVMSPHGRYGILGCDPFMVLTSRGKRVTLDLGGRVEESDGDPFAALRRVMRRFSAPHDNDIPFAGGAVGYLAYDLGQFVERLPCTTLDDIGLPEMYMAFYDAALILDMAKRRAWAVAAEVRGEGAVALAPPEARIERLLDHMAQPAGSAPPPAAPPEPVECNFTREEYLRAVQRAKDYIAAGDIFQVNLSRRFETRLPLPPHELYLRLRAINPAPMAAYLQFDGGAIVSASPERFLEVRGRRVETRPIKGTRPRGRTPEEDRSLGEELLASEKDNAELAMIVDLERNDLGRVCSYGSVKVVEPRALESHPTVHHLVATIEGRLQPDRDIVDLLRATFPGGSITGAPKIRAMEIIDELEPTRRSVYTGAIGYIGFDGSMDLNIVIRTFIERNGTLYFQVGGGVVADSDLALEYDETTHKARALLEALAVGPADAPMDSRSPKPGTRPGW